jgi:protein TonB
MLPVYSQESKPDEVAKQSVPRAGRNGIGTPECVYCPPPGYSEKARAAKFEGAVLLEITVTTKGKATDIKVIKGQGYGLEERAIEAVKNWKFKPAKDASGNPVEARMPVELSFRIP